MRPELRTKLGWFLAYLYAALLVTHVFANYFGLESYDKASLGTMVKGTAYRPFVTRALVPAMIRGIGAITPREVEIGVAKVVTSRGFIPQLRPAEYTYATFLFLVLTVAFFVGTAYTLRELVSHYYHPPGWLAGLAGATGVLLLPLMFRYYNYVYDPATILLASLMALCLAKRQARWLFYVFVVACVNKETAILALPLFVVFYWKQWPKWAIAAYGSLLVVVWAGIRAFIGAKYARNAGVNLEMHWEDHQMVLLSKYPMAALYFLVFAIGFILLVRRGWRGAPWEVRAGLLITLVPLFASAATIGYIDELRALYDAYPYMFLAVFPGLVWLVGGREALSVKHQALSPDLNA
jgi:hypothetical protein